MVEQTIKRSTFITCIAHTCGIAAAKTQIATVKTQHSNARHNCWAYVAGQPDDTMQLGFSDDGEPTGTAGKPILSLLLGSNLGEICTVVTRYYGGVKLGTGGLVRAYSAGLREGLSTLETQLKVAKQRIKIEYNYDLQGVVDVSLQKYQCVTIDSIFSDIACVIVDIDANLSADFRRHITNTSRGKIVIKKTT